MIEEQPSGVDPATLKAWNGSTKPTLAIFQRALDKFDADEKAVDPATSISEWDDMYGRRYKGLKKPSGVKHGIVRTFTNS